MQSFISLQLQNEPNKRKKDYLISSMERKRSSCGSGGLYRQIIISNMTNGSTDNTSSDGSACSSYVNSPNLHHRQVSMNSPDYHH